MLGLELKEIALGVGLIFSGSAWASYTIIDLGTLGGTYSAAAAINNNGEVVGDSYTSEGISHAFLYTNGAMTDLGTLGGSQSGATDINDSGEIVGGSEVASSTLFHPFLYQSGIMVDIASSYTYGVAEGINNDGRIVGWLMPGNPAGVVRGFIYNSGSISWLGTFGGSNAPAQSSFAFSINSNNRVVGRADVSWVNNGYAGYHAFLYSGGTMTDIHASPVNQIFNTASDINDSDTIVGDHWGTITTPTGTTSTPRQAFVYSNGVLTDLGTLPGATDSIARAINNSGDIVGVSQGRGFLYTNGAMTDLNTLLPANSGWLINDAFDINDYGMIVGNGVIDGEHHAFLMTPGC